MAIIPEGRVISEVLQTLIGYLKTQQLSIYRDIIQVCFGVSSQYGIFAAAVDFGVNIQAANHVFLFTRTWNPAKEDQATDRAYRIGKTKDVYVYYPVITADFVTFDMKLDNLLNWKRGLSDDMLNGCVNLSGSGFDDLGAPKGGTAFADLWVIKYVFHLHSLGKKGLM